MRHHDGLSTDVLEPISLHLFHDPIDRLLKCHRAGNPMPKAINQFRQSLVGIVILSEGIDQTVSRLSICVRDLLCLDGWGNQ
jgi:hypothetical protein